MSYSVKKQIISNTAFILVISLVLSLYCKFMSSSFVNFDKIQRTSVSTITKKTIVLDPGHGGEDSGTIGYNGILEKDLNLMISMTLASIFRFVGYEVIETRKEDIMLYDKNANYQGRKKIMDLATRLNISNDVSPDIFVGIHMNAFPEAKYSGLTVYYSPNNQLSHTAGSLLREDVIKYLQPDNNRALKASGSNIYLLNRIKSPAILIECGFLSNPEECSKLSSEEYRHALSFVIFSSLTYFLEN